VYDDNFCPYCGKTKPIKWNLCRSCLRKYGKKKKYWPKDVRYMVNSFFSFRMALSRDKKRLVGFVDADCAIPYVPKVIMTRDINETEQGGDFLPYAPYDNEQDNKRYRRANRIKERE